MTFERQALGRRGEDLALEALKKLGYETISRNYRCKLGEVDLIARDGDTLVFVEIKTRRAKDTGGAKEAVSQRKRRQLSKVAMHYMKAEKCLDQRARFDVVAVSLWDGPPKVEVIKDAFELVG